MMKETLPLLPRIIISCTAHHIMLTNQQVTYMGTIIYINIKQWCNNDIKRRDSCLINRNFKTESMYEYCQTHQL